MTISFFFDALADAICRCLHQLSKYHLLAAHSAICNGTGDTGLEIAPGKDVDENPDLREIGNIWNVSSIALAGLQMLHIYDPVFMQPSSASVYPGTAGLSGRTCRHERIAV